MKGFCLPVMLTLLCAGWSACQKYDEGGAHRAAHKRLYGTWIIQSYTVNGADSLDALGSCVRDSRAVTFSYKHQQHSYVSNAFYVDLGTSPYCWQGTSYLKDNKDAMRFSNRLGSAPLYPFCMENGKWEILQLTDTEFRLQRQNDYGDHFALSLIKQ